MPTTATLHPDTLDLEAARLYETAAWQQFVANWHHTTPEPTPHTATQATRTPTQAASTEAGQWRNLLTVPVDQLISQALQELPAPPPRERALPGRAGAILPDRLHAWRRIGQPDIRPSQQLAYARQLLLEWGWQNTPYRLRDHRGARCLCGAVLTCHRLGYGTHTTANRSVVWLLTELRHHGWAGLVGEWNRAPGRTAQDALALIDASIRRASHAGE